MHSSSRMLGLAVCLAAALLLPSAITADTLKITSTPPGATVEINGVVVGTTPYEMKVPGGYFHKTHSAWSTRLEHAMVLRVSKDGYATKEITMADGPMPWISVSGKNHGDYYLLKAKQFDIKLGPLAKSLTGAVEATVAGNSNVELRPELSVEDLVQKSSPAVVVLRRPDGQGSGFFVTDTGVIATNAHVARGQQTLMAVLPTGQELEAKVVYIDSDVDIALVKVDGNGYQHLRLADVMTVHQGQSVVAIGNPGGGLQNTATRGIVSAVGAKPELGPGTWIQTDAAINHGNSGGPLLNAQGEAIGVNTWITRGDVQGINFALSARDLLAILHRFYPTVASSSISEAAVRDRGTGAVNISADAENAEIYVDGKFVGTTPSTLRLPAGPHDVEVKAAGRRAWRRTLEVLKDSEASLKATLEPER